MRLLSRYGKAIAMSAAALGMTAALTVESASAYFTTYVSAGGTQTVNLGAVTEIHEDVSQMTKHISIENTSEVNDCFVRVKVFYADSFEIVYTDTGGSWYEMDDGYWYYDGVLAPGEITEALDAQIVVPEGYDRDSFNVVVIQECTPAVYDQDGNAAADWTTTFSEYEEVSENQGEGDEQA